MLAGIFVVAGVDTLRRPHPRARTADFVLRRIAGLAPEPLRDPVTLVRINAAAQVGAGTLLAVGRAPRLAALVLAGSLVPTTIGGHAFWRQDDPAQRMQQLTHFLKNTAILGGLLLAALEGLGRPRPPRRG